MTDLLRRGLSALDSFAPLARDTDDVYSSICPASLSFSNCKFKLCRRSSGNFTMVLFDDLKHFKLTATTSADFGSR